MTTSADLLPLLRECLTRTNAITSCLIKWPDTTTGGGTRSDKKKKIEDEQITKLIEMLNLLIHEINNLDMALGDEETGGELWDIKVPVDLIALMDYEDLNPELYVKQLLKICLNMEANLQRRKQAMSELGGGVRSILQERKRKRDGE